MLPFKCSVRIVWFSHFNCLKTEQVYLNFVVLPQGVRGYLIAFVRPPCGWSTGFFATPRTIDFFPRIRQNPLLPFESLFLIESAEAVGNTIE